MIVALLNGDDARTSHGEQVRDFMHVADVGAAFASLLDSSVEGAVNLGTGYSLSIREVALAIADRLGARDRLRLGAIPARPNDPPRLVPDVDASRTRLGFSPRYALEEGLEQTMAWWREAASAGGDLDHVDAFNKHFTANQKPTELASLAVDKR